MKLILLLISIFLMGSCSIEKRMHQPGWHIEWKKKYISKNTSNDIVVDHPLRSSEILIENHAKKTAALIDKGVEISVLPEETLVKLVTRNNVMKYNLTSTTLFDQVLSGKNDLVEEPNTRNTNQNSESNKKTSFIRELTWLVVMICAFLLAAGICAIIFGQHWAWLVLGIVLIVVALIYLFAYLITLALGRAIVNEYK